MALRKYDCLTGQDGYLSANIKKDFYEALQQTVNSERGRVDEQLNTASANQRENNRHALSRINLPIEYRGRLGLPLQCHRNSGELKVDSITDWCVAIDDIACNDNVLEKHKATSGKNAANISRWHRLGN
jgi:hypothetical protein